MAPFNTILFIIASLSLKTLTLAQDLTFTITEESGSGSFVGSVSNVNLNISLEDRASLIYFLFVNSDIENLFSLNESSSRLYTKVNIDRESICKNYLSTHVCSLMVKIGAKTANDLIRSLDIQIIVNDINDNAPIFPTENTTVRISEGVTLNASFPIIGAEDLDTGSTNGIQSYEINPTSSTFDLITAKNLVGNLELKLVVKQSLDRETQDSYVIRILAKDGGSPVRTGSLTVIIIIDDINDNQPIFDKNEYNVSVDEGLVHGTLLLKIHADDKDSGLNGLVSYRINDRFTKALNDFTINISTGEIKVLKYMLVFQADFFYSFIVEAYDNDKQPQISQVWVYIYVLDTGNNPPDITLNLPDADNSGSVNIVENSNIGAFVAHLSVRDPDIGANGYATCVSLNNHFDVVKFSDAGEFKVIVKINLDREVLDMYNATIVCSDHGTPALSASVSFLVRVSDYNDNQPIFDQLSYSAKIPENTKEEQIILQVSASDKDFGKNKEIHFEIRNQDKIFVNAITGVISVKPYFDREITPIVIFEVLAIDAGDIPLMGTATVTLTIQDVNDNKPDFLQTHYFFEIEENLDSGTTINHLSAKDLDIGINGRFTFTVSLEQISLKLPIVILSDGTIQLIEELDREEQNQYSFYAKVTDQGDKPLSSKVPVTIFVTDVNDNDPNINFPRIGNQTVSVLYPSSPMDLVAEIEAHDLDFEENGTLQYDIIKGNELGLFRMDSNLGKIFLIDSSKRIDQDILISLLIEVKDNGKVSRRSAISTLFVNVIYTNATYDLQMGDKKLITIVVAVVVVTIFLSAILIAVMLRIRTWDKKRKQQDNPKILEEKYDNNKPALFLLNNTGQASMDFSNSKMEEGKKKKEVSFSLDECESIKNFYQVDLQVKLSPNPLKYEKEKSMPEYGGDNTQEVYDKDTTRLESLKIQKMYLENRNIRQQQQIHRASHGNPDDSRSESSGETSSGDSGRGVSEEEMPSTSTSHDNQKMFNYDVPNQYLKPKNQAAPMRTDTYNQVPPPIPHRKYKPYSSFNNSQSYSLNKQYPNVPLHRSSDKLEYNTSLQYNTRQTTHSPQLKYPLKSNNNAQTDCLFLSPHHLQYHQHSQENDDCSTTTSGSYTLPPQEDLL